MRRLTLLGLFALALPTVALAGSIDPDATNAATRATTTNELFDLTFGQGGQTIDFRPAFSNSTTNPFSVPPDWTLTLVGGTGAAANTITLMISNLGSGCATVGSCMYSGTLTASGPGVLPAGTTFSSPISGMISRAANSGPGSHPILAISSLTGMLTGPGIGADSNLEITNLRICTGSGGCSMSNAPGSFRFDSSAPTTVELDVDQTKTVIPEPGTLGMLGTGLIGLAGMTRRKLKLWV